MTRQRWIDIIKEDLKILEVWNGVDMAKDKEK